MCDFPFNAPPPLPPAVPDVFDPAVSQLSHPTLSLITLAVLNLTRNNVHGALPHELFAGPRKMTALDLSGNHLGGTLGGEMRMLEDLEGACRRGRGLAPRFECRRCLDSMCSPPSFCA